MILELTNKQYEGLKIALKNYRDKKKYTVIAGFAGTGKSTLINFIIAELGLSQSDVAFCAYTGKAVQVLREKGCPNAVTAHKLLYKSYPKPNGNFMHIPVKYIPYKIVIVDEVSMLPKKMWDLLISHRNIHVIALGDPGQLPPIGEATTILDTPDVFLNEIMRQALESEIIRLSKDVREGKPLKPYKGKEINIIEANEVVTGMYNWADQIICGRNETRNNINTLCRKLKWGEEYSKNPKPFDKVICLRNDWDIINEDGDALVNGCIGEIGKIEVKKDIVLDKYLLMDFIPDYYTEDSPIDLIFRDLRVDYSLVDGIERKYPRLNKGQYPELFDYGYAITTHKSQGSEYRNVLLFEEVLRRDSHRNWLYTGITRAKNKLTIVKAN